MTNNVEDFVKMRENIVWPPRPKKTFLKRNNFSTNREYHIALADAEDRYEQEVIKERETKEECRKLKNEIDNKFWEWMFNEVSMGHFSQSLRGTIRNYACSEWRLESYYDISNRLESLSDIILMAYQEGLEKGNEKP